MNNLEKDRRLYKVDVTVEDDYIRVSNIKRKIYTGNGSIIFFDFNLWQSYFYKLYCDYYQKRDHDIILESFYFHYNLFEGDKLKLIRAIKKYVKECRTMQICNFKF